ncbi:MAG: hypothetical protein AMJ81_08765 [Phycisphaerae bacterium SM23_33]|jgi:uncharacterized C2H2 Zn-finger protein|nr:MAG: hypothetical protein AMJ81_08765 [Phycisphaerae bacterium SM23_33]
MAEEKYVLNCPRCGRVEGYVSADVENEADSPPDPDMFIEEQVVRTPGGTATRVRCPRCGRWIKPDRAHPA